MYVYNFLHKVWLDSKYICRIWYFFQP